jgi:hypothetical protein
MGCAIKRPDKSACPKPAAHRWGTVEFCCEHFDLFVEGLLDLKKAVQERRHIDMVEEYNRKTKRSSLIEGAKCEAFKRPDK